MGLLDRAGQPSHLSNRIVLPGKIYALPGKKLFDDSKRLFQATNSRASVLESQAQLLIIEWPNACSQSQFKAPTRQEIQRCYFFREKRGMPEIITEHRTANAEQSSDCRRYCQRWKYC